MPLSDSYFPLRHIGTHFALVCLLTVTSSRVGHAQPAAAHDLDAAKAEYAVGVIGVPVWHYLDDDPEGELAHRRLAREHNARLKRELGLPDDYEITPYVQPGGGGFALSGSF